MKMKYRLARIALVGVCLIAMFFITLTTLAMHWITFLIAEFTNVGLLLLLEWELLTFIKEVKK